MRRTMDDAELSTEALVARYEVAAGKAAVVELKLRILAETVEELQHIAHDQKFNAETVYDWFAANGDPVSADEQQVLEKSRKLRNKLHHCELHSARRWMLDLGAEDRRSGARTFKLDIGQGNVRGQIEAALADGGGVEVADTTTEDAGIGAWLLDFAITGAFEQAAALLASTSGLLDRLIDRAAVISIAKDRAARQSKA